MTNPYVKRAAQGAASGALSGGAAGWMLGGPVPAAVGLVGGGLVGGLLSRPGDDEERLRARMRKLEMGVLGQEEAAIMNRFMDPVRGAGQQQEVARRGLEQGTVTSGASARRAQAAQRGTRRDLREAAQEGTLAVMDLGERRRADAQRINELLEAENRQRDAAFRQGMATQGLQAAAIVGSGIAGKRAQADREGALLPRLFGAGRNAADLAALSEDEAFDQYWATRDPSERFLPEAADPVAAAPVEAAPPVAAPAAAAPAASPAPAQAAAPSRPAAAPARDVARTAGGMTSLIPALTAEQLLRIADMEALSDPSLPAPSEEDLRMGAMADAELADRHATKQLELLEAVQPGGVDFDLLSTTAEINYTQDLSRLAADLQTVGEDSVLAYDPDFHMLRSEFPDMGVKEVADLTKTYKGLTPQQRAVLTQEYSSQIQTAGGL